MILKSRKIGFENQFRISNCGLRRREVIRGCDSCFRIKFNNACQSLYLINVSIPVTNGNLGPLRHMSVNESGSRLDIVFRFGRN